MISMIMVLVRIRSFTLTSGFGKLSRKQRLKNGVPQESVLAPLLFDICTHDLPATTAEKFAYANDLATLDSASNWQALEGTRTQDMATLSAYLQKWKLKLSTTKTISTGFHLYNNKTQRELKTPHEG